MFNYTENFLKIAECNIFLHISCPHLMNPWYYIFMLFGPDVCSFEHFMELGTALVKDQ